MIFNQWYAIMDSGEIKQSPVAALRMGEKMVLWRDSGHKINCIADQCCHRGASLGKGVVVNGHVECPFHGFQYDGSGRVKVIPANGKNSPVPEYYRVKSYPVREAYGLIWLWWGEERTEYPEIPFFDDLKTGFEYTTFIDPWPVHYSRSVENQLDVVHLPFVHKTTIGRGNKTLVHGPVVEWNAEKLRFYVYNVVDDSQTTPLTPSQITDYQNFPQLEFQFPNFWQNIIAPNVRVFAAFVPVDETNSLVYIRFYQKFMKLPLLKNLVHWAGIFFSKIILNQDKQVVITQRPLKSSYIMDEKLIPGDLPIIEYRKHRDELMKKNNR